MRVAENRRNQRKGNVTLVVWTNLTLSPDGEPTANALMLQVLDTIYTVSPLAPAQ